jgi:hypothetical protein
MGGLTGREHAREQDAAGTEHGEQGAVGTEHEEQGAVGNVYG